MTVPMQAVVLEEKTDSFPWVFKYNDLSIIKWILSFLKTRAFLCLDGVRESWKAMQSWDHH